MSTLSDDDRWQQWRDSYDVADAEITALFHQRHVWRNLLAMLQGRPDIKHHSVVNSWLSTGYTQTIAVGIRRQWDRNGRRPTMGRLLSELAEHSHVASWERYSAQERGETEAGAHGWLLFALQPGGSIDPDRVRTDLADFDTKSAVAREWVNTSLAHRDRDTRVPALRVRFDDLNGGLETLGGLLQHYLGLFRPGTQRPTVTPEPGLGWLEMFDTAWLPEDFEAISATDAG